MKRLRIWWSLYVIPGVLLFAAIRKGCQEFRPDRWYDLCSVSIMHDPHTRFERRSVGVAVTQILLLFLLVTRLCQIAPIRLQREHLRYYYAGLAITLTYFFNEVQSQMRNELVFWKTYFPSIGITTIMAAGGGMATWTTMK